MSTFLTAHPPERLGPSKGASPHAGASARGVVWREISVSSRAQQHLNSLVFAISHGPCAAAPSTPSQCSTLPHHAVVPSRFRVQVRWATQRSPPSEPLPSARVIQRRVRRRNLALRTAFPSSLVGRYSYDYYGASVTLGLAPLRRSHVRPRCTYLARLRRPTHLLECPHRASLRTSEVASTHNTCRRKMRHRLQASFRWMELCIFWRLGFR